MFALRWCSLSLCLWLSLSLLACASAPPAPTLDAASEASADVVPDRSSGRWACPQGWVSAERGGCGPAVVLCAPDGGAAQGACEGYDLARRPFVRDADGGVGVGFYRLPEGGVGGGWPEPGAAGGPPAEDWAPDAGIPSCPAGWRRSAEGLCDPALRGDCPANAEALPGGACTATSSAECPSGAYADPGPEALGATLLRVRAGADPAGADGTEAHPFATIVAALAVAGPDAWVLLAEGTYREALDLRAAARVVGRCAASVTLQAPSPGSAVRASAGARVELRSVTVSGGGLEAVEGAQLRARGVRIQGAVGQGLLARGAGSRIEATELAVQGTVASPGVPASGQGARAMEGGQLVLSRAALVGNREVCGLAEGVGSRLELSDAVVSGTRGSTSAREGLGLQAGTGAVAVATRTLVQDSVGLGVFAVNAGSRVELTDTVVRGTRARADRNYGWGVSVEAGAALAGLRVLLDDNTDTAVYTGMGGARLELTDSVVRATRPAFNGAGGYGLLSNDDSTVVATRVLVADCAELGAGSAGVGSRLEMQDCVVRDTRARRDGTEGYGVTASEGSSTHAQRLLVYGCREAGVFAISPGTVFELEDSVVRDPAANGEDQNGYGLAAQEEATFRATRALLLRNVSIGAGSFAGATLELRDSIVRGTRTTVAGGGGYGLSAESGSRLLARGVLVADNQKASAYVANEGTQAELTECALRGALPVGGRGGYGLDVESGAAVSAARTLVAAHREMGVAVFDPTTRASLSDVLVLGVAATARGMGAGVTSIAGAEVSFERLSVVQTAGVALAAATYPREQLVQPSLVRGSAVFVRDVAPSTVQPRGALGAAAGVVAYGLQASSGCSLEVREATVDGAQYGAVLFAGDLSVRTGAFSRLSVAAASLGGSAPPERLVLDGVGVSESASASVVTDNTLPEVALDAPPACLMPPCM